MKVATPLPGTSFQHYMSEDQTINAAVSILAGRMKHGTELTSPADAKKYVQLQMADLQYETFWGFFLDVGYRVLAAEELFRGTNTQTPVFIREIARRALELNASYLIVAHNHPSGRATPSEPDKDMTYSLGAALAPLDVTLIDHYIVGGGEVFSFVESGTLMDMIAERMKREQKHGIDLQGLARDLFGDHRASDIGTDVLAHMSAAYKAPVPAKDAEAIYTEERAGREAFRAMVEEVVRGS